MSLQGNDMLVTLAWGSPGLVLIVVGYLRTLLDLVRTRGVSSLGARLRFIGWGVAALGWITEADLSFIRRGAWPPAVLVIVLAGWAPLASFWLAARVRGPDRMD